MSYLIIIGGSKSLVPFIETAKKSGFSTILFDRNPSAPGAAIADRFYDVSTHDKEKIQSICAQFFKNRTLVGVLTYSSYPQALEVAAQIAEEFALPSYSLEAVKKVTDKLLMKKSFEDAGVSTPEWISASDLSEATAIANKWCMPLIVKPVSGCAGSLGIKVVNNLGEFADAFKNASTASENGQVLIEKFYQGSEFHVDGIISNNQPALIIVSQKFTNKFNREFLPLGYSLGAGLACSKQDSDSIGKEALKAVRSMCIDNSFFGADVLLTPNGPLILEVGILLDAKMDRLLSFSGVDVYDMRCQVAVGNKVKPQYLNSQKGFALRFMYANSEGRLLTTEKQVSDLANRKIDHTLVEWEREDGDIVELPNSVADILGWVMVESVDQEHALDYAVKLAESGVFSLTLDRH